MAFLVTTSVILGSGCDRRAKPQILFMSTGQSGQAVHEGAGHSSEVGKAGERNLYGQVRKDGSLEADHVDGVSQH